MKIILATILSFSFAFSLPQDIKPASVHDVDSYAGIGEKRDSQQIAFSQAVVRQAKLQGGTVKISTWVWKGKKQWYAQRLVESWPGAQVWQWPNPPMGYHTAVRTYQIISYASKS